MRMFWRRRPTASLQAVKRAMAAPTDSGVRDALAREGALFPELMGGADNARALSDLAGGRR